MAKLRRFVLRGEMPSPILPSAVPPATGDFPNTQAGVNGTQQQADDDDAQRLSVYLAEQVARESSMVLYVTGTANALRSLSPRWLRRTPLSIRALYEDACNGARRQQVSIPGLRFGMPLSAFTETAATPPTTPPVAAGEETARMSANPLQLSTVDLSALAAMSPQGIDRRRQEDLVAVATAGNVAARSARADYFISLVDRELRSEGEVRLHERALDMLEQHMQARSSWSTTPYHRYGMDDGDRWLIRGHDMGRTVHVLQARTRSPRPGIPEQAPANLASMPEMPRDLYYPYAYRLEGFVSMPVVRVLNAIDNFCVRNNVPQRVDLERLALRSIPEIATGFTTCIDGIPFHLRTRAHLVHLAAVIYGMSQTRSSAQLQELRNTLMRVLREEDMNILRVVEFVSTGVDVDTYPSLRNSVECVEFTASLARTQCGDNPSQAYNVLMHAAAGTVLWCAQVDAEDRLASAVSVYRNAINRYVALTLLRDIT